MLKCLKKNVDKNLKEIRKMILEQNKNVNKCEKKKLSKERKKSGAKKYNK
jgi:hypothetical protein